MMNNATTILSQINAYSVTLAIIVILLVFSFISEQFKHYFKTPLKIFIIVWIFLFGYNVYTGNDLYTAITTPSQSEIEAAKYKTIMIDGREVIYNKDTGEVAKKPHK